MATPSTQLLYSCDLFVSALQPHKNIKMKTLTFSLRLPFPSFLFLNYDVSCKLSLAEMTFYSAKHFNSDLN